MRIAVSLQLRPLAAVRRGLGYERVQGGRPARVRRVRPGVGGAGVRGSDGGAHRHHHPVCPAQHDSGFVSLKLFNVGPSSHRTQSTLQYAQGILWNTLWSVGVFTQLASNIKGFASKFGFRCAYASCVNGPLRWALETMTRH